MSILHSRIVGENYLAMPGAHPVGTADTPMAMPLSMVSYASNTVLYGAAQPLVTADGATVPAVNDVVYPDPVPAGRS